jgi:hypothetical protein
LVVNASSPTDFVHLYQPLQSDPAPIPDLTKRRLRILFVDDDVAIRRALK